MALADHTLWARGVKSTFLHLTSPISLCVLMRLLENLWSHVWLVSPFSWTALPQPFGSWGGGEGGSHNLGETGRRGPRCAHGALCHPPSLTVFPRPILMPRGTQRETEAQRWVT